MNHQDRYLELQNALMPWSAIWSASVLENFEPMENRVPEEWFHFGATASLSKQFELSQGNPSDAAESLREWVNRLRTLCLFEERNTPQTLPPHHARGLTPKKKHEIEGLLGFLGSSNRMPAKVIDLCGGAGHLARHLAQAYDCPVDTIDQDVELQAKGLETLNRHPWLKTNVHGNVRFVAGHFPEAAASLPHPQDDTWAVGLHTCGNLAWSNLSLAPKGYSVLNVGCCYERMNCHSDVQRSRFVQSSPLGWTSEALFVAGRGGVERSRDEFLFQQRVQKFRFTLDQLLKQEGQPIASVGNTSSKIYRGSFAAYARNRTEKSSARLTLSDATLEAFYRSQTHRTERLRFAAFLKNIMARPLEISLLLDRAIWLEEAQTAPEGEIRLLKLFDARISPRNIAISAPSTSLN